MNTYKFFPKFKLQKTLSFVTGMLTVLIIIFIAHQNYGPAFGCYHGGNWRKFGIPQAYAQCYGSSEDPGGGGIPPDLMVYDKKSSSSGSLTVDAHPHLFCWKPAAKTDKTPVTIYWEPHATAHLQVYDSKGVWWFNGWVKSNSYTVFSENDADEPKGVPMDGRIVYAKLNFGGKFTAPGSITCK